MDRTIDVGRLVDGTVFVVMAGAGFDAAMMREEGGDAAGATNTTTSFSVGVRLSHPIGGRLRSPRARRA